LDWIEHELAEYPTAEAKSAAETPVPEKKILNVSSKPETMVAEREMKRLRVGEFEGSKIVLRSIENETTGSQTRGSSWCVALPHVTPSDWRVRESKHVPSARHALGCHVFPLHEHVIWVFSSFEKEQELPIWVVGRTGCWHVSSGEDVSAALSYSV
jgi:hypothetical protein